MGLHGFILQGLCPDPFIIPIIPICSATYPTLPGLPVRDLLYSQSHAFVLAIAVSLFAREAKSTGEKSDWSIEYGSMKYTCPGWSWVSAFNGFEEKERSWIEVQTKCSGGFPLITWLAEMGCSKSSTKPLRWTTLTFFNVEDELQEKHAPISIYLYFSLGVRG